MGQRGVSIVVGVGVITPPFQVVRFDGSKILSI